MELSRLERAMLANQLRILELLHDDEDEAQTYAEYREALERGYEYHFEDSLQCIDRETMTADECKWVLNVLSMFESIKYSVRDMPVKPEVEGYGLVFRGFCGNTETKYMSYAEYFCTGRREKRFEHLEIEEWNSHMPTVEAYQRMVDEWEQSKDKHQLTKEDVERIAAARVHPSNRR